MKSRAQRYRYVRHVAMSCFPDGVSAPPTLSYASPQSWTYGAAISTLSPTTTGATSFAVVSGALPTGVTVHATTGVISGTPTLSKVAANVTIRATGPGGTADATINIAVPSPLYTSLVDYWNLDEESGTRVGSHAGLDLTDNNTVTSQATGGPDGGRCAEFSHLNSESLSRADSADLRVGSGSWTAVVWLYFVTDGVAGESRFIAKYPDWGMTRLGSYLASQNTSGTVQGDLLSVSAWDMNVSSYSAGSGKLSAQSNNGTVYEASLGASTDSTGDMVLGGLATSGVNYFLTGRMAYVGLWKRVLTSAEKTWLYNSGAGRAYSALATYDGG